MKEDVKTRSDTQSKIGPFSGVGLLVLRFQSFITEVSGLE